MHSCTLGTIRVPITPKELLSASGSKRVLLPLFMEGVSPEVTKSLLYHLSVLCTLVLFESHSPVVSLLYIYIFADLDVKQRPQLKIP